MKLNHTIVHCTDQARSALFLAELFGRPAPTRFGHFHVVTLDNDVSLDYMAVKPPIAAQHYAFLVSEEDFSAIFERIQARGLEYWADPALRRSGQINTHDGGRGVYFKDPDGHLMEALTVPYGGW
ncbi:MAG: VOC family protein [Polyangiaceae bacterium]|nr:VOC family protein [Myxococcales bacterium]MCB9589162.1 VOC family protein [Polyangiaceae bacterium]MCB9610022.1 VOC family protein [Polyangiaceae bacterium]